MAQQTAMQTFIAWGDEMLLNHPQKILSFGEAIDKAVELLPMEKEQMIHFAETMPKKKGITQEGEPYVQYDAEQYYNQTYVEQKP